MILLKHLPNFLTSLNLLCGCLAIVFLGIGDPLWAAYLVIAAAIFDFFDGFLARLLNASSPIGGDLDSLADMVTFGVVPGLTLLYYMLQTTGWTIDGAESFLRQPLLLVPFLIPVFSALRLAKFNVDTRQTDSFRGLPTPASAMWVMSIPLMIAYMPYHIWWKPEAVSVELWFIVASAVGLSVIMISELPLLAMKFKGFGWKGNEARYGLLIISVLLLIILRPVAIPLILSLYVLISIIDNLLKRKNEVQS
jgi:CDP-diacylglycerol--serine O-phosphatidyltransferase